MLAYDSEGRAIHDSCRPCSQHIYLLRFSMAFAHHPCPVFPVGHSSAAIVPVRTLSVHLHVYACIRGLAQALAAVALAVHACGTSTICATSSSFSACVTKSGFWFWYLC